MDSMIVLSKLDSLHRCLSRVEGRTPESAEALENDYDSQDIISLNLGRAVQVCVDIASHIIAEFNVPPPSTMGEGFDQLASLKVVAKETALRMKKAVGFRNISVHEYRKIDWTIVYFIVTRHLDDFRKFAKEVLEWSKATEKNALS